MGSMTCEREEHAATHANHMVTTDFHLGRQMLPPPIPLCVPVVKLCLKRAFQDTPSIVSDQQLNIYTLPRPAVRFPIQTFMSHADVSFSGLST